MAKRISSATQTADDTTSILTTLAQGMQTLAQGMATINDRLDAVENRAAVKATPTAATTPDAPKGISAEQITVTTGLFRGQPYVYLDGPFRRKALSAELVRLMLDGPLSAKLRRHLAQ